ncbi:MAG: pentapeptide repeat-containing protein, partial [Planctomycetes bacterium]|nr:pentapeptide repeat-containing protein [Planctomycetota bacterium]
LAHAKVADVAWEGADLRGADLDGAIFHMGSSRGGLVESFLASEGTRTGFYTDDFDEQHFKSPEEIRKADLRGADLRGAKVERTDFYLVDLRDALYDEAQELHFRRCRAILRNRRA